MGGGAFSPVMGEAAPFLPMSKHETRAGRPGCLKCGSPTPGAGTSGSTGDLSMGGMHACGALAASRAIHTQLTPDTCRSKYMCSQFGSSGREAVPRTLRHPTPAVSFDTGSALPTPTSARALTLPCLCCQG